jgi:hypothetical protein
MAYIKAADVKKRVDKRKNEVLTKRKVDTLLRRVGQQSKTVFGIDKQVWPDEKRVEAVNVYLIHGNMTRVAEITGIPVKTLRDWKQYKPWWKELEAVLREEHDAGVAGELSAVVDKTISAIADRVKNGDFIYNPRSGEIKRVPVSAANLNKIASSMIDRKLTLQKQPTKYTASTDSKTELDNKLSQLAAAFAKFTSGRAGDIVKKDIDECNDAIEGELVA